MFKLSYISDKMIMMMMMMIKLTYLLLKKQMQNIKHNNSRAPNAEARAIATMSNVAARSKQKRSQNMNSRASLHNKQRDQQREKASLLY